MSDELSTMAFRSNVNSAESGAVVNQQKISGCAQEAEVETQFAKKKLIIPHEVAAYSKETLTARKILINPGENEFYNDSGE